MSALFGYAKSFYEALDSQATDEVLGNGESVRIFRGKLTNAFKTLSISQSYYSKLRRLLINTGCITIIQQGARGHNSIVQLHRVPTDDVLSSDESDLTRRVDPAIVIQRLDDLQRQIGSINIASALQTLEEQVRELRGRVAVLEQRILKRS